MAEPTSYIVLRKATDGLLRSADVQGPDVWEAVDWNVPAASAEAAIRKTAAALNPADGAYVATPMRSWKPLTVTATTQTIVTLNPTPETT